MKNLSFAPARVIAILALASGSLAHGQESQPAPATTPHHDVIDAQLDVDRAAMDAVSVVERFSTALTAGRIERAVRELDPKVVILESGGIEQSRDEYLAGHAAADAEFLKNAHVTLQRRTARATGDLAWVASQSQIHVAKGAETLLIDSTETMVLHKATDGWKIVHIHWSSRRASSRQTGQT
jgi:ketosteroid isomerase-like protein